MIIYNKKFWTILVVSLILFLGVNLFITKPVIFDIVAKIKILKEENQKLSDLKNQQNKESALSKQKNKIDELYNKTLIYLPKTADSSDFIVQIEAIGNLNHQDISELTFAIPSDTGQNSERSGTAASAENQNTKSDANADSAGLKETNFNFTQTGEFSGLRKFIDNMETMSRMHSIQSLVINIGINGLLETKINGSIYSKSSTTLVPDDINLTDKEIKTIDYFMHFGKAITPSDEATPDNGRSDPFTAP